MHRRDHWPRHSLASLALSGLASSFQPQCSIVCAWSHVLIDPCTYSVYVSIVSLISMNMPPIVRHLANQCVSDAHTECFRSDLVCSRMNQQKAWRCGGTRPLHRSVLVCNTRCNVICSSYTRGIVCMSPNPHLSSIDRLFGRELHGRSRVQPAASLRMSTWVCRLVPCSPW